MTSRLRKPSRRIMWIGGIGLVLVLFVLMQLRETPVSVESGEVSRGPMRVTIDEEGRTRVRDRFVVSAPITGRLERLTLRAGDAVQRGTTIARMTPAALDPRTDAEARAAVLGAQAALREAEASVPTARAALDQARRDAERARTLLRAGAIAERDAEDARLREADAERSLASANERVAQLRAEVQRARALSSPSGGGAVAIVAPVAGQILRVVETDSRVLPAGSPLLEIGNANALEIVVDLRSEDAVRVQPGAMMVLDQWGGNESLTARVRVVEPHAFTQVSALGVEEQRVNIVGDFTTAPSVLGDGYRVGVRIVVWEAADALRVPRGALFRDGSAWSVFVIESGRAKKQAVQIGQQSAEFAEVLSGLTAGQRVVLHPSDKIVDGLRVE